MNEGLADEGGGRRGFPPPGGARPFAPASAALDPLVGLDDATKPLRSKLLAVPALRARYVGYVRTIAEQWLDWRSLDPLVMRHQALIAADVKADTRKLFTFEAFESGLRDGADSLRGFVDARRTFLLNATR
jgi:hypothetical protein